MSKEAFGKSGGTTLTLYKGYPQSKRDGGSWNVTYRYWCQLVLAESLIPAAYSACPHPDHGSLVLKETSVTGNGSPGMCDVELVYKPKSWYAVQQKAGDTQKSASVSMQEIPIDDPRLVSSGILAEGDVTTLKAGGHQTYAVGSCEYTYTEWASTFTWSESNLVGGIGSTESPTGLTSATANNWMRMGKTVRTQGDLVEVATTWRYNKLGWTP